VKVNLLLKHAIHVAAAFAAAATASVLAQQPFQPNLPLFALPDDVMCGPPFHYALAPNGCVRSSGECLLLGVEQT